MANLSQYGRPGAANNPLFIDDDDIPDQDFRSQRWERAVQEGVELAHQLASRNANGVPDGASDVDGSEEQRIEDILSDDIAEIIDLTGDDSFHGEDFRLPRDQGRKLAELRLDDGFLLLPGMTIELKDPVGAFDVQFLRIDSIWKLHGGSDILLRGWGFVRTRQLEGLLPCKLNEVAMIVQLLSSDPRPWEQQGLVDIPLNAFRRVRVLKVTNAPFPEHRFNNADYVTKGRQWVENWGPLVCRYRYEIYFNMQSQKPHEWALVRIPEVEADLEYRIPDERNLHQWRRGNVPGGSYIPRGSGGQPAAPSPGQRYTAGDVFAGAGGASRGIERAGVRLLFAVDHWSHAAETLASNFPESDVHETDVTTFITENHLQYTVDILHLSPPCQFWSPAHTVAGKNDTENIDVLFSCGPLVNKFHPRLFTLEQTFGILSPKFKEFFNSLICGFTAFGYSVRWKVVPLANYGVPQLRKRLLMIGAAPGEKLPRFPAPTHSKDGTGGLKPWATPRSVLATVSRFRGHELHRPERSKRYQPPKPSWNPSKLARTITTSGGQNYHWNGERDFTLLEYALLQGFPHWHKFRGSCIKKQIGNAFAPSVVQVLYDHLVSWLLEQDGFDPSLRTPAEAPEDLFIETSTTLVDGRDELVYLGSSILGNIGQCELINLDVVDDLSDSETVRGEEGEADTPPAASTRCLIDLTGMGLGTEGDPYILSAE